MYYLEATNKETLIERCKYSYWDKRDDAHVFFGDISHSLYSIVSPKALHGFFSLANKVDRRNVLFITEKDLIKCLNVDNSERFNYRGVREVLNELRDNGVFTYDIPEKRKKEDNPRRIIFNIDYVWKGDIKYKRVAQNMRMRGWLGRG